MIHTCALVCHFGQCFLQINRVLCKSFEVYDVKPIDRTGALVGCCVDRETETILAWLETRVIAKHRSTYIAGYMLTVAEMEGSATRWCCPHGLHDM